MLFQLLGSLAIIAAVLLTHNFLLTVPNREELGPRVVELRFEPVRLDPSKFAPVRLLGAWVVSSDDPRVGGISGIAVEGDQLVALTDSGAVIRFAKPGRGGGQAHVRELPGGPGDPRYKKNRDSESVARDAGGRGWWVAFENRNELWLYSPGFERALDRIAVPQSHVEWNIGIEGLAKSGRDLLLLPENGGRMLRLASSGWTRVPFTFPARRASGAAALSDDSVLVIERRPTLLGFANALVRLDRCNSGYCLAWRKPLPLGMFDNVEAIAAEPLASGATRLWLMTDDNSNRPLRTLLIAADLPPHD